MPPVANMARGCIAIVGLVFIATLLTAATDYFVGDATIYTFYMVAIVAVGFRYGMPYLLLAGVLSSLTYAYYFADPPNSFAIERPEVTYALVVFTILAVVTGRVARYMRRTHRNLRHARDSLLLRTEELSLTLEREMESRLALKNFVAMMCHEFRTPLTTIDIIAQNQKRAATAAKDDKALTAAESIRTEIQRMNLLLTSLAQGNHSTTLEASRTSSVSLRDIVTEVCDIQRLTTPSHEITVTGTWPAVPVHGDPQLLRQLFANLLINAAKYSGADQAISVEAETGPGFVEVAVGDRGIGIPADERERVFEQFYRASNTGAVEGTGLGLTLCRQIVQAHRGTIRIGENVPSGTKITVRLPIGA